MNSCCAALRCSLGCSQNTPFAICRPRSNLCYFFHLHHVCEPKGKISKQTVNAVSNAVMMDNREVQLRSRFIS